MALSVRYPVLLDEDMQPVKVLHPIQATAIKNLMPPSTATLKLSEGENIAITDWVEVFSPEGSLGKFRVSQSNPAYPGNQNIILEHGIATLKNDVFRGDGKITGTFAQILQELLEKQETKYWELGSVVSTPEETITYLNDRIFDLLSDALDLFAEYALEYEQGELPWKINIVKLPTSPDWEGRFSRNVKSVRINVDRSELCTKAYVSGSEYTKVADTASIYGKVAQVLYTPQGATGEQKEAYVDRYVERAKEPRTSISVAALDLFDLTGEIWDKIMLGKLGRCCLPDYGLTINNRIVSVAYDDLFGDERSVRVTLANRPKGLADIIIDQQKNIRRGGSRGKNNSEKIVDTNLYAHAEVSRLDGRIDLYASKYEENTDTLTELQIKLDAAEEAITLRATKTELASTNERVTVAESEIRQTAEAITLTVKKGDVISSINQSAEEIQIKAAKINLSGYVTASQLSATNANITNLTSGVTTATVLKANAFSGGTFNGSTVTASQVTTAGFTFANSYMTKKSLTVTTPSGTQTIYYLGYTP